MQRVTPLCEFVVVRCAAVLSCLLQCTGVLTPTVHAKLSHDKEPGPVQKQVERKVSLTAKMLESKIEEVKGAVVICYPMGLPQWDAMRLILEGSDDGPSSVRARWGPHAW